MANAGVKLNRAGRTAEEERVYRRDYMKAYLREYKKDPENRERHLADIRQRYLTNPAYRALLVRASASAAKKYPHKTVARRTLRDAVKRGEIVRPTRCQNCTRVGRIQGHHPDYDKPLDVEWLCQRCHGLRHRKP